MKTIILFCLLAAIPLATSAQQVNEELKTLILETFAYYPKLKEADESSNTSDLRVGLTQTGYVPQMNAGFSYNYIAPIGEAQIPTGPGTFQTIRFQPNNNFNGNIALNYVVYDFGRLQANIRRSREEFMAAKDNAALQRTQLAAQVSQYYYALVYLRRSLVIEDSLIAVLQENKRIVERKLAYGDALQLDLLSIQSALDMEEMHKVELQTTYQKQLIFITFLSGKTNFEISGNAFDFAMPDATAGAYLETARKTNFDFSVAAHRLEAIRSDLRFNRSQFLPYLSINAAAGIRNGYQLNLDEMRFNYVAGAGITVPILDAVKTTQQIKITKSIIRQQEYNIEALENTYRRDIGLVTADLQSQKLRLGFMDNQIGAAEEALRIAKSRFTNGTATYLELINAAYNLQKVQLQKVQIEYGICLSNIELARLTGATFY